MASGESKGSRRYDKENLLWQSTVVIKSDPVGSTLGIASREYFTKAYLRPLAEAGLIERSDPVHPNSPQQKYALTKEGKRRIEKVTPL